MTVRYDFRGRIAMIVVWLVACCALALTGCSDASNPRDSSETAPPVVAPAPESDGSGETTDPVVVPAPDADTSDGPDEAAAPVVLPPDAWEPPMLAEADILAHRLLRRDDDSLLLDAAERDDLAREIAAVLSRIRDAYPTVADVTVWVDYAFGELLLTLEPGLFEAVAALLDDQTGPVVLRTGHAAFDALNESLGLSAVVDVFSAFRLVTFYFNEYLNVPAAAAAYAALEGIEYADPNAYVGDGPDIDMVKSTGRWYVVARRAWGDCPAGCIYEELDFFIVDGTGVQRIDPAQAMGIAEFRELVTNRGWTSRRLG